MAGLTAFAFLSRVVSNVGALSSSVRLINLPSRRLVGQKADPAVHRDGGERAGEAIEN